MFGFGKNKDGADGEKKNERRGPNPIIWIIVGAYLIYISYQLYGNFKADGGLNSSNWYFLIFIFLFVGFAIWLFIRSGKQLAAASKKNQEQYEELRREEEAEYYNSARSLRADDDYIPTVGAPGNSDDVPVVGAPEEDIPVVGAPDSGDEQ